VGNRHFGLAAGESSAWVSASLVPKPLLDRLNGLRVAYAKRIEKGRGLPGAPAGAMQAAQRSARASVAKWLALELKRVLDAQDDAAASRVLRLELREAQENLLTAHHSTMAERISLARENASLVRQLARAGQHRRNSLAALDKANAQRQADADSPKIIKALKSMQAAGADIWDRSVASELAGRFGCTDRHVRELRKREFPSETEVS
jgi:hypothetical protein